MQEIRSPKKLKNKKSTVVDVNDSYEYVVGNPPDGAVRDWDYNVGVVNPVVVAYDDGVVHVGDDDPHEHRDDHPNRLKHDGGDCYHTRVVLLCYPHH